VARMTCFDIAELVIIRTPVDTGYARGSWQPSLNAPVLAGPGYDDPSGAGAISQAGLITAQMQAGDTFYMFNNASYIYELEYGSSMQAPNGMVRVTIAQAQNIAKANLIKAKQGNP